MKISFVIVNYQSRQYLEKCIASVFSKAKSVDFEVIVANNDKDSLKLTESVKVLEINENIGFGKASNLATKEAKGEVLCFLNPDTEILTDNIEKIIKEFEKNRDIGIIGPKIVESSGEFQKWSVGVDVTLRSVIKNNIGFSKNIDCSRKTEVDWVTGAALFIKKELFEKLEGFDEEFFLYFEDVDLCKRLKDLNKKVIYFSGLKVRHLGGKSSSNKGAQKKEYYKSQDYYFKKHFGVAKLYILKLLRLLHK